MRFRAHSSGPVGSSSQVRKWVYFFSERVETDDACVLLGGKGAGLAEMTQAGLPVPPGFTITTQAWGEYKREGELPQEIWDQTLVALARLEKETKKEFGGIPSPLLVSVRSGARVSMPGIMETVLNVGLNDETVKALTDLTDNRRFAFDAYRRLIQMLGRTVKRIDDESFRSIVDSYKKKTGVERDSDLATETLEEIVKEFKRVYRRESGESFPDDLHRQLRLAIEAVFASWDSQHAQVYREQHSIPDDWGTAVTVQSMVFGNLGPDSGTGVVFTRDPATGEKKLFGEYLLNAQGEDVVRGIGHPRRIYALKDELPQAYEQLEMLAAQLERRYCDMQDMEFTIERGKLWLLQTRGGKRTAQAALKIAMDLFREEKLDRDKAILRIEPSQLDRLMLPGLDPTAKALARQRGQYLAQGLGASPGAATGLAVLDASRVGDLSKTGPVILVQPDVTLADVLGNIEVIAGILTQKGGVTSHPMVVARARGVACVTGCRTLQIDAKNRQFTIGGHKLQESDILSLDGTAGDVFLGEIPTTDGDITTNEDASRLLAWADAKSAIEIWANADCPWEIERARRLGAKGIGLCRTERMFFAADRLDLTRQLLLAVINGRDYQQAFKALLDQQRDDFARLFEAAQGLPIVIRLLDAPIQDFLPDHPELEEMNPSMGLRGARWSVLFPEVTRLQARAMFEAACELKRRHKIEVDLRIAIPMVSYAKEFEHAWSILTDEAEAVMTETDVKVSYDCGVMIETPRAALIAGKLAEHADFLAIDSGRLTEATLHYSRHDFEITALGKYIEEGVVSSNPFERLDGEEGVGRLMRLAVEEGRQVRSDLVVGICGFHGGVPESMQFYQVWEPTYISCPRSRIPVTRLSSAQAQLRASHPTPRSDLATEVFTEGSRQKARSLLLRLGPQRASLELHVQDLRMLLRDADIRVRYRAAFALGLRNDEVLTNLAEEILHQIPSEEREQACQMLIEMLNVPDDDVRAQAVWALSMMKACGPAVIDALNQVVEDRNEYVRALAAVRLGELGDSRAFEPLCRVVTESADVPTRARAAAALGQLDDSRAVDTLVAALSDDNAEVCWNAIHALGQLGDVRAASALRKVVAKKNRHPLGLSLADEADRVLQKIRKQKRRSK